MNGFARTHNGLAAAGQNGLMGTRSGHSLRDIPLMYTVERENPYASSRPGFWGQLVDDPLQEGGPPPRATGMALAPVAWHDVARPLLGTCAMVA